MCVKGKESRILTLATAGSFEQASATWKAKMNVGEGRWTINTLQHVVWNWLLLNLWGILGWKNVELKNAKTSSEIQSCLDLNEVKFIVEIYLCFQVNSFTWEGFYSDFAKIWKMTNNTTLRGKRGIKFDFWRSLPPSFLINIGIMRMKHLLKQWFFIKEIKTRRCKTQVTSTDHDHCSIDK